MTKGAYYNDPQVKEKLLAQIQEDLTKHRIIQGDYWNGAAGCLIGNAVHGEPDNIHECYSTLYNIPVCLALIFEIVFELLPLEEAQKFTLDVHQAIVVGSDLSLVTLQLVLWMFNDPVTGIKNFCHSSQEQEIVESIISCYQQMIWTYERGSSKELEAIHSTESVWSGVTYYTTQIHSFHGIAYAIMIAQSVYTSTFSWVEHQYPRLIRDSLLSLLKAIPGGNHA